MMDSALSPAAEKFNVDVNYEILQHLQVADIIRARRISKKFRQATLQRSVWANAYRKSDLLLPPGPLSSQRSRELQNSLIRATILRRKWIVDPKPKPRRHRMLPPELSFNIFSTAIVISGRYLVVAESNSLHCYNLDLINYGRHPVFIFKYGGGEAVSSPVSLQHQVNANSKGSDVVWISLRYGTQIVILKVAPASDPSHVQVMARLPAEHIVSTKMEGDFLILYKTITPGVPLYEDIFHIPTGKVFQIAPHGILHPNTKFREYIVTSGYLILIFALDTRIQVDLYLLPDPFSTNVSPTRLTCACTGSYPQSVERFVILRDPLDDDTANNLHVTLLAITYLDRDVDTMTGPSQTKISVLDIVVLPDGTIGFTNRFSKNLDVRLGLSNFFFTSRAGRCLAVNDYTYNTVMVWEIHHGGKQESKITNREMPLPVGVKCVRILAFDGLRGRLLILRESRQIDVLDYV